MSVIGLAQLIMSTLYTLEKVHKIKQDSELRLSFCCWATPTTIHCCMTADYNVVVYLCFQIGCRSTRVSDNQFELKVSLPKVIKPMVYLSKVFFAIFYIFAVWQEYK